MGTSLTTTNNGFRYPAGLVGEPPDVPDDIRKLAVDLDGFLVQGTWFPSLGGANGATVGVNAGSDGTYLKIGKHVSAKGRFIFGSNASFGAGTATVSSLPGTLDTAHSSGYGWYTVAGNNPIPVMLVPSDGANLAIRPIQSSSAGSPASLAVASTIGTPAQSATLRFTLDLTLA